MVSYEALYRRKYNLPICWEEVGEKASIGPELVKITNKLMPIIIKRLRTIISRKKSYVNVYRKKVDFE